MRRQAIQDAQVDLDALTTMTADNGGLLGGGLGCCPNYRANHYQPDQDCSDSLCWLCVIMHFAEP